jgi:hypothetical protein
MLPTRFRFIWPRGFREEDFYKSANQKQELPVAAMFVTWPPQAILVSDWLISKKSSPLKPLSQMNRNFVGNIYGRSSIKIGSFGQAVSEKKIFLNRPIRNKNCLWRLCLLMDWNKMSNLYKNLLL